MACRWGQGEVEKASRAGRVGWVAVGGRRERLRGQVDFTHGACDAAEGDTWWAVDCR